MSTTKEILVKRNPNAFAMRQPSVLHDIYVVGVKKNAPDPNDASKTVRVTDWLQISKPNAKAKEAGVKESNFIHTTFKPAGTIKIDEASGEETFSGPKKNQVGVTFQSAQPGLYNFIEEAIKLGEGTGYVRAGEVQVNNPRTGKTEKRPQIKLKRKMWGRIISLNVPEYTPHNQDANGVFKELSPVTLNPATGQYKATPVVMGSIKFFADDDDLDLLEEAAARVVDKRVRPWVIDKKTLVVDNEFGNRRIEVTEPVNTGENPDADPTTIPASDDNDDDN